MKIGVFRRIVALSRSDRIAGTSRHDLYLVILSVFCGIGRHVTKAVLASQFFGNLIENFSETVLIAYNESSSSGLFRKFLESTDIAASAIDSAAAAASSIRAGWKETTHGV